MNRKLYRSIDCNPTGSASREKKDANKLTKESGPGTTRPTQPPGISSRGAFGY